MRSSDSGSHLLSSLTDPQIDELVRLAGRLTDATGKAALPHFRASALVTDNKEDGAGFDPVTVADHAAEQAVRDILAIERPEDGFRMIFSAGEFPAYDFRLDWEREGEGGNYYSSEQFEMEGWLCPALLKYFDAAPESLYVKVEAKGP